MTQAQQGQAGLRFASELVRSTVRGLRLLELAAHAVQLGPLVERRADGGVVGQPLTGAHRFFHGVGPRAMEQHDLGPMHEALAAVEHEVGLRFTPVAQCRRPLVHPSQIEQLLARLDDGAIHVADRDRRHLTSSDRHHGLVEQRQPRSATSPM